MPSWLSRLLADDPSVDSGPDETEGDTRFCTYEVDHTAPSVDVPVPEFGDGDEFVLIDGSDRHEFVARHAAVIRKENDDG